MNKFVIPSMFISAIVLLPLLFSLFPSCRQQRVSFYVKSITYLQFSDLVMVYDILKPTFHCPCRFRLNPLRVSISEIFPLLLIPLLSIVFHFTFSAYVYTGHLNLEFI